MEEVEMNGDEDEFKITRKQLNWIILLKIIQAAPDKIVKAVDFESEYAKLFRRAGIISVLTTVVKEKLIEYKTIAIGENSTVIISITPKGEDYIKLV